MKILKIAVIVLVAAFAAYIGLEFLLGSAVRAGVNTIAPRITKTRVRLDGARISPFTGSGTLTGLFVGNPQGWSSEKAFSFGRIRVAVAPLSLLGDHVIVKDVVIEQPEFVYETRFVSSNIGELLKNVSGPPAQEEPGQAPAKKGKPMKFEVRHFLLRGGRVTLGIGSAAMTMPMPPVELTDLGTKEGGITSDQLAVVIMRAITTGVVSATTQAAGKIGSTMGAAADDAAKRAGESLKGLFGGKK